MPKPLSILAGILLSGCMQTHAQQPAADPVTANTPAVAGAIMVFHQSAGLQSQLYNGRTHIGYPPNMLGSAYYLSNDAQLGAVEYDHILFEQVPLWYDEVREKLVVRHFNVVSTFELWSERVSRFWIGTHPFIRLVQQTGNTAHAPATGFYEVLASGKLDLLARRKKLLTDVIENLEVKKRVENNESFFARMNGTYYSVNNQRSLLSLINDKKKQVQQYMKKNGWKFRRDPENYLIKAVTYYNQSTS